VSLSGTPIGVVLAGGMGRRIGGAKATVQLCGRPLISYPLGALSGALEDVAVLAKPDTALPTLPGVRVWIEPRTPRHPLFGILHALDLAQGRTVLVSAADLPFVTCGLISRLAAAASRCLAPTTLATLGGEPQPLLGCYRPAAARRLSRALALDPKASLREVVAWLDPEPVEVSDPAELFNINDQEDLLQAAAMLSQPNVKS
jgi:molybdenum cofactor guanylyltransferase